MIRVEGSHFEDTTVRLDGCEFINCHFVRCDIVYEGGALPSLIGNVFSSCEYRFEGAAGRTLAFLGALYAGGVAEVVEATIAQIRGTEPPPLH